MRALTIRQPWAFAITALGKDVENRSRNIAGKYRGRVAIHAAKGVGTLDEYFAASAAIRDLTGIFPMFHAPSRHGAVVAVAELVAVDPPGPPLPEGVVPEGRSRWAMPGHFQLVLDDVRELAHPVPARGALGLWTLPGDVEEQVLAQLSREVPS